MLGYLTKGIKLGAVLSMILSGSLAATSANADPRISRCGQHTKIIDVLEKRYGETARGIGVVSDKGVMQVYVSEEKGTWTILMTNPQGTTCLLAAGRGWENVKQAAKGENA